MALSLSYPLLPMSRMMRAFKRVSQCASTKRLKEKKGPEIFICGNLTFNQSYGLRNEFFEAVDLPGLAAINRLVEVAAFLNSG